MKIFVGTLAMLALSVLACRPGRPRFPSEKDAIVLAAEPEMGKPLPFHAKPHFLTTVTSSHMVDAYYIRVDKILYTVGVERDGSVSLLTTSDPLFRTPEGLHTGSTVDDVRAAGATSFDYENGFGCSAKLPSGWNAGSEFVGEPLICKPQIVFFFKRHY